MHSEMSDDMEGAPRFSIATVEETELALARRDDVT
jgi:hypothetical protein